MIDIDRTTRHDWLVVAPLVMTAFLLVIVPRRTDLPGHMLAGFGATLIVAWLSAIAFGGRPWVIVAVTLACVALGVVAEQVLFPLAGPDLLDITAQSGGALWAGATLIQGRAGDPDEDWFDRDRFRPSPYGTHVLVVAVVSLVLGTGLALR